MEINEKVESDVDDALALVEKGKIEKGRLMLEELIKKHPGNHMVNYGLGVVSAFEKQFDKAIKSFTRATDIFPYFVEAHFNKGVAYMNKFDPKNAIKAFRETVEVGDDHDEIVQQAKNLIRDFEEQVFKKEGISLEKYFEGLEKFEKAFSYMEKEEWSKAITGFRECLEINNKHQQSYGNMGICYAQLGQKAEALAALDMALAIDPNYELAAVNKVIIEESEDGEGLKQEKIESVEYYKDYPLKNKSYIESCLSEIIGEQVE